MMRLIGILLSILVITSGLIAMPGSPTDTLDMPSTKYSKLQYKKELKDIKRYDKQLKQWKSAVKKPNPDYLNSLLAKFMATLDKEHDELSYRISERSKKMLPPGIQKKQNSAVLEDKPKVYNAELADQKPRITKEEIFRKKMESDYLSEYIPVVREQKRIQVKLKKIAEFSAETPSSVYGEVTKDLEHFKDQMKLELDLMKKETAKK